ncbi:MAG TPA: hypothetical protein VF209_01805 [Patescibacteria group bacterium]
MSIQMKVVEVVSKGNEGEIRFSKVNYFSDLFLGTSLEVRQKDGIKTGHFHFKIPGILTGFAGIGEARQALRGMYNVVADFEEWFKTSEGEQFLDEINSIHFDTDNDFFRMFLEKKDDSSARTWSANVTLEGLSIEEKKHLLAESISNLKTKLERYVKSRG